MWLCSGDELLAFVSWRYRQKIVDHGKHDRAQFSIVVDRSQFILEFGGVTEKGIVDSDGI